MELAEKVAIVTGGAGGLGRAVCRRFAEKGAHVTVVDIAGDVEGVAREIGGIGVVADITRPEGVKAAIAATETRHGPVDLFVSNAGVGDNNGLSTPDVWDELWRVHVMAHLLAAQALLPSMIERAEGYLVSTASGAALTADPISAPYSVTKHAAFAFAEWLAMTYTDRGIRVSCFCPFAIRTPMLAQAPDGADPAATGIEGAIEPEQAADALVAGIRAEEFLILSHPEALTYFRGRAQDHDRWLRAMRRLASG
ncbi:MAG TPA: SDR family oxidoreductase [Acidimicrobiales bacterium]|jgi:NAD(P)-dependent dehydrogenase (short-subunit alcohol dehydrogenase family)